jgi:hypothetical protein
MLACLSLFCWIGNELTKEVRIIIAFNYVSKMHIIYRRNMRFYTILSTNTILHNFLQAETVRHAAWECDWVGTPVPFQRCLAFIIATANKEFTLTAGKFVPVSNSTFMNVRT